MSLGVIQSVSNGGTISLLPSPPTLLMTVPGGPQIYQPIPGSSGYQYLLVKYVQQGGSSPSLAGLTIQPQGGITVAPLLNFFILKKFAPLTSGNTMYFGSLQFPLVPFNDSYIYIGQQQEGYLLFANINEGLAYISCVTSFCQVTVYGANWNLAGLTSPVNISQTELIQAAVNTSAAANTMVQFPGVTGKIINIVNTSGVTLIINQTGIFASSANIPIPNGIAISFVLTANSSEYYVARQDGVAAPVAVNWTVQNAQ